MVLLPAGNLYWGAMQAATATGFADLLGEALRRASADGVALTPGASAMYPADFDGADEEGSSGGLEAFEADPVAERDPGGARGESEFSYFLDGVQEVREVCRVGTVPVVVATVAAAVARREERRLSRLPLEGVPGVVRAVILPREADPAAGALFEAVKESGIPFSEGASDIHPEAPAVLLDSTRHAPEIDPADYPGLRTRAYVRARALGESLETELLRRWSHSAPEDGWIAVDGQLPLDVGKAAGIIKTSGRPFLRAGENRMLLDLEAGRRTTAFVPPWRSQRVAAGHTEEERASWYVRMWPPQGEATDGLVRVEVASDAGWDPEDYDEITRWLLSERAPLATPDPRWRTLIYPIRYVERILKPAVRDQRRQQARLQRILNELTRDNQKLYVNEDQQSGITSD